MDTLRRFFNRSALQGASRFDRYYGGVLRAGVGYPTADEARQDMLRQDRSAAVFGWNR